MNFPGLLLILLLMLLVLLLGCAAPKNQYTFETAGFETSKIETSLTEDNNVAIKFLTSKNKDEQTFIEGSLFSKSRFKTPPQGYLSIHIYNKNNDVILEKNTDYIAPTTRKQWQSGVHFTVPLETTLPADSRIVVTFSKQTWVKI